MPQPSKRPATEERIVALIAASQYDVTVGPTGPEIAKTFGITKQAMSGYLKRLENARRIQRATRGYITCPSGVIDSPNQKAKNKYDEYLLQMAERRKKTPAQRAERDS